MNIILQNAIEAGHEEPLFLHFLCKAGMYLTQNPYAEHDMNATKAARCIALYRTHEGLLTNPALPIDLAKFVGEEFNLIGSVSDEQ